MIFTGLVLFIYLLCCQIPLYGVQRFSGVDPLYWMRVILASNKGTLMELGISPLITSNMVMEVLANARIIAYDSKIPEDRRLLQASEKLLAIIVAFTTALAYVWSGMYGEISQIGIFSAMLIIGQLFAAGIIVLLLDELMQKGYGMGSGVSLFIATNICENIFWRALSPITNKTDGGMEFEGALVNFIHQLVVKNNKLVALQHAMYRSSNANMNNLLATVFIFFIVIYFQGFKIDIKLANQQVRGAHTTYPIKLFYLSSTPIILQTALVSNLHFFSGILYKKFKNNAFVRLLGVWQENDMYGGGPRLIGGFAYYLTPPQSFLDVFYNPKHAFFYFAFIMITCALFSKLWLEMSGRSTSDVVKQITEQGMFIQGSKKESMVKILNKYIPTAAVFGGMCIGVLTIIADLLGAIGSGTT